MKRERDSEERMISTLEEYEAAASTPDLSRRYVYADDTQHCLATNACWLPMPTAKTYTRRRQSHSWIPKPEPSASRRALPGSDRGLLITRSTELSSCCGPAPSPYKALYLPSR